MHAEEISMTVIERDGEDTGDLHGGVVVKDWQLMSCTV